MYLIVLENDNNISRAMAFKPDKMPDGDTSTVFGYGTNPDSALRRLFSDYPEVTDYRMISRRQYEELWDAWYEDL